MNKYKIQRFSFIDNPDGVGGEHAGIYFDDNFNHAFSDDSDDIWDDLVRAVFDALGVLHKSHPYRRLDGTFTLEDGVLKFVQEWVNVSSR